MTALEKLQAAWERGCYLCVGLDLKVSQIPGCLLPDRSPFERVSTFARAIIQATAGVAAAYKPNLQFYEGAEKRRLLLEVARLVQEHAPRALLVADGKEGDIGKTNVEKAAFLYGYLGAEALTLSPYVGGKALEPFLQPGKLAFVLCRTSNEGAEEFQHLVLEDGVLLYEHVAWRVANHWLCDADLGLVVGATAPAELVGVRRFAPELPILIPGVGSQGGDLRASVRAGRFASVRGGFIINDSSRLLYGAKDEVRGADFADVAGAYARDLNEQIVQIMTETAVGG